MVSVLARFLCINVSLFVGFVLKISRVVRLQIVFIQHPLKHISGIFFEELFLEKFSIIDVWQFPICFSGVFVKQFTSRFGTLRSEKLYAQPVITSSKFNNRNTRATCEISSKLTIKITERRQWRRFDVFIVNFEHV